MVVDARLREALEDVLAEEPNILFAILFGSRARGRARPESDVDLAVLPRDADLPLRAELALQARLERDLGRPVDVLRLDRADPLVRWEVARHGVPVLCRDRRALVRFVARAALEHADIAPLAARAGELFRRRILAGGTGS
jgi:predicted nucleotidyltransferase